MNTKQLLVAVQNALLAATWTGGNKVFPTGSVIISPAPEEIFLDNVRVPMAIIRPQDAQVDPEGDEAPDLLLQRFLVRIIVLNANDPFGQGTLVGANLTGGANASEGKGILDLEAKLFTAIEYLNSLAGVQIFERVRGATDGTQVQGIGWVTMRDYQFEALVGAQPA